MIELTLLVGLVFCMLSTIIMIKLENNQVKKRKELDKTTYDYALENAKKRNLELVITRAKIEEIKRFEEENERLEREIEELTKDGKRSYITYPRTDGNINRWVSSGDIAINRNKEIYYIVNKGDTLNGISYKFQVSSHHIMLLNNLNIHDMLRVGKKLRIR